MRRARDLSRLVDAAITKDGLTVMTTMQSERVYDPAYYEFGRYGDVLRMIRAGATDDEITAKHPAWEGELPVCHKIVNNTLSRMQQKPARRWNRVEATPEFVTEIGRLIAAGYTHQRVADMLGVTRYRVVKTLKTKEASEKNENV